MRTNRKTALLGVGSVLLAFTQAPAAQQSQCESPKVVKMSEQSNGTIYQRLSIVARSPLSVQWIEGGSYMRGELEWNPSPAVLTGDDNIKGEIAALKRLKDRSCTSVGCDVLMQGFATKIEWLECVVAMGDAGRSSAVSSLGDIDTVTPQVPGCPKYLRKSLVTWRQVGNPQLNTWEIRNRSDKTLKVTFRDGGSNSSPDTLPPGQSTQVSLSANQVPSYVVRDFDELFAFNRANGAIGKTLQCDLAIRPR